MVVVVAADRAERESGAGDKMGKSYDVHAFPKDIRGMESECEVKWLSSDGTKKINFGGGGNQMCSRFVLIGS